MFRKQFTRMVLMKRGAVVTGIRYAFIFLFVYAAVSKLLDVSLFTDQLRQSPFLFRFAREVAWGIPVVELLVVGILLTHHVKTGLVLSTGLMGLFTLYIIGVLYFSPFVPCSCGGLLSQLGWEEHLVFNLVFVVLGGVGVYYSRFKISDSKFQISD